MTEPHELTRQNLTTMRKARSIVVRTHLPDSAYPPPDMDLPASWLECIRDEDPGDGYGQREYRAMVPINNARISNYSKMGTVNCASWVLLFLHRDTPMGTLVHYVLRVGDRLSPHWVAGNDSDNLRNSNLTQDEIGLFVERGPVDEPSKCKRLYFRLDSSIYPPHSLARPIHFTPLAQAV
jgi:hypothetical protein